MDCKYTCFDRVLYRVKPLPQNKLEEAYELITDYSLWDLLDFCIDNHCFSLGQAQTLYEGIIMWEDLDGNYYEEDYDKLESLYEAIGITDEFVESL